MAIPFTQYFLPNGRQEQVVIDMDPETEKLAQELIAAGFHFDIETLTTGMISMTCEKDEDMVAIKLASNGPAVVTAVEDLVRDAYEAHKQGWKPNQYEEPED